MDRVPNIPNNQTMIIDHAIMAAGENEFESFLKSIDLAKEYLERFKETDFDDIGLGKSLESEEQRQMFDLVGLSAKPGHLLKFKKAVAAYFRSPDDTGVLNTSTQRIDNSVPSTVPQKKVQKSKCCCRCILCVPYMY